MSGQFEVRPGDVQAVAGSIASQLLGALNTAVQAESLPLSAGSFSRLGSPVAAASDSMRGEFSASLRSLLALLQKLNNNALAAAAQYQSFDQNAATALGAGQSTAGTPVTPAATSAGLGGIVAGYAQQAGAPTGTGTSVAPVLGYLAAASPGRTAGLPGGAAVPDAPGPFADWLDKGTGNQASLGLVKVYAGAPAAIQPGDVVVGSTAAGTTVVGLAGTDGRLYNGGPVGALADLTSLRGVYRPVTPQGALW
jgi:hypothetical protein